MSATAARVRCARCGASPVHVRYDVPVLAVVEGRRVTRVVVVDEAIGDPVAVECPTCGAQEPAPGEGGFAGACALAESAAWPGWDHGW